MFVLDVNSSLEGEDARPGFHPEARYEFRIHLDGAAIEELTYRVTFGDRDEAGRQAIALHILKGSDAHDDSATGDLLVGGRTLSGISGPASLRLWAGPARDPFYVDLRLVHAVNSAVQNGTKLDLDGWTPQHAHSDTAGTTINSIILELADEDPHLGPDRDIGVWSTTKLPTDTGGWQQISRVGHPMMWPIFRPNDAEHASDTNRTHPADEVFSEGKHIAQLVAGLVAANGTSEDAVAYGALVSQKLLPDVPPYRTGSRASYGFIGQNGRALADNAPEVMFSLVMNSATSTGLTACQFADTRSSVFPYVVAQPATME